MHQNNYTFYPQKLRGRETPLYPQAVYRRQSMVDEIMLAASGLQVAASFEE